MLAVALEPAPKVVTVPIVKLGVWPSAPAGPCGPCSPGLPWGPCSPWGPCGPISPGSPLSPLSPLRVPASSLFWNVCPSLNVIWLALPVSLVTYPLRSTAPLSPPNWASAILLVTNVSLA